MYVTQDQRHAQKRSITEIRHILFIFLGVKHTIIIRLVIKCNGLYDKCFSVSNQRVRHRAIALKPQDF